MGMMLASFGGCLLNPKIAQTTANDRPYIRHVTLQEARATLRFLVSSPLNVVRPGVDNGGRLSSCITCRKYDYSVLLSAIRIPFLRHRRNVLYHPCALTCYEMAVMAGIGTGTQCRMLLMARGGTRMSYSGIFSDML